MSKKQHFNYVPDPCEDIQVNCCKNPTCPNFGVPHLTKAEQTQKRNSSKDARYKHVGSGSKKTIKCNCCNENIPIKNNKAIWEELSRFKAYFCMPLDYACPSPACENNQYCIYKYANKYRKFGLTSNGKQRFQCTSCKKTFSLTPKHQDKNIHTRIKQYLNY